MAKTSDKSNYVEVFIPLVEGESDDVFVSVNDSDYLIKRGEPVPVPPEVAEVLTHARIQTTVAMRNAQALQKEGMEIK